MSASPSGEGSSEEGELGRILAEFLAAEDAGLDPVPREWVARHPGFAADLEAFFADRDRLGAWARAGHSEDVREADEDDDCVGPVRYFGDYELARVLGRGGMGVVYLARQVTLDRPVALKMIRSGRLSDADDRRRFRREAEAVAQLNHPNLLTILEVGEHEGRSYFTMPLIGGGSLADHLPRYRADPRLAAGLIVEVANAIHHAHQRGILHRDLKPANVLVDESGRPFVADFGLAKRAGRGEETQAGAILGTPAYMAPEQASGRPGLVTTASDIYGLGAILYTLVAGRPPFTGDSPAQILRGVCEDPPERPSRINRRVGVGLEVICLKCLEKEPARRYESAHALADDLARWLEGRPLVARPVGPLARAWMWCRRKPAVAGMAAALSLTLGLGAAFAAASWAETRRQKGLLDEAVDHYVSEWDTTRALNAFLVEDLLWHSSPLATPRRDVPVAELLDRAAGSVGRRFAGRPKVEAGIRKLLADSYRSLGDLDKADAQLAICLRLCNDLPARDEPDRLSAYHSLAGLRLAQGRPAEALKYASRAFEGRRRSLGEDDPSTLDSANQRALALKALGRIDDAEKALLLAREISLRALGPEHRISLASLGNLALIEHGRNRPDKAQAMLESLRSTRLRLLGPAHPETILASSNLGSVLLARGDADGASKILAETLEVARAALGPGHEVTLSLGNNLAAARVMQGAHGEAEARLDGVIRGRRAALPPGHPAVWRSESNRAVGLIKQGKADEAEGLLRVILDRQREGLAAGDPDLGITLSNLAAALLKAGRPGEAEGPAAESVATFRAALPAGDHRLDDALALQGTILLAAGKFEEAESVAREALAIRTAAYGAASWKAAAAKSLLGGALAGRGAYAEAERLLTEGYAGLSGDPGVPLGRVEESLDRLARLFEAWGRPAQSALWRRKLEDLVASREGSPSS